MDPLPKYSIVVLRSLECHDQPSTYPKEPGSPGWCSLPLQDIGLLPELIDINACIATISQEIVHIKFTAAE